MLSDRLVDTPPKKRMIWRESVLPEMRNPSKKAKLQKKKEARFRRSWVSNLCHVIQKTRRPESATFVVTLL